MRKVVVEVVPNIGSPASTMEMLDWTVDYIPFVAHVESLYHGVSLRYGSKRFHGITAVSLMRDDQQLYPFTMTMRECDFIVWKLRWLPRPLFRGGFFAEVKT